MTIAIR